MFKFNFLCLGLSLCLIQGVGYTVEPHVEPSAQLKAELSQIKTFSAQFNQRIVDPSHRLVSRSEGRLWVKRPNQFNWLGEKPDRVRVVSDGQVLWTYDIELEQIIRQPLAEALDRTPAALLAGDLDNLDQDFKVSWGRDSDCLRGSDACFRLIPREQVDKAFTEIYISMQAGRFIGLTLLDQLGQRTLTQFKSIQVNEPINDSAQFKFVPPKGVDVVDYR